MYDGNFSALRAFFQSESKTKFSRMRAVAPSGVCVRFTIAEFGALRASMAKFELLAGLLSSSRGNVWEMGLMSPEKILLGRMCSVGGEA